MRLIILLQPLALWATVVATLRSAVNLHWSTPCVNWFYWIGRPNGTRVSYRQIFRWVLVQLLQKT